MSSSSIVARSPPSSSLLMMSWSPPASRVRGVPPVAESHVRCPLEAWCLPPLLSLSRVVVVPSRCHRPPFSQVRRRRKKERGQKRSKKKSKLERRGGHWAQWDAGGNDKSVRNDFPPKGATDVISPLSVIRKLAIDDETAAIRDIFESRTYSKQSNRILPCSKY